MIPVFIFLNEHKKIFCKIFCTAIVCLSFYTSYSQKLPKANYYKADLHLRHVVQPKETYNSIGRLYGISGKEVADYNNVEYDENQVLAKYLTIPLRGNNYTTERKARLHEFLVPVYRVNGSEERIVRYKKNSNKTASGYSLTYINNRLVSSFISKPVLTGFLHIPKGYHTIFTTVAGETFTSNTADSSSLKRDTGFVTEGKDSMKALVTEKKATDSTLAALPSVIPSPIIKSSIPKHSPLQTVLVKVDNKVSRPKSRVDKVYILVKIQIVIWFFLVTLIFLYMAIRNRKEVSKARLDDSLRAMLVKEILVENTFTDHINRAITVNELLAKQLEKKSNSQFVIDELINGRKNIKGKFGDNFLKLYLALRLDVDSAKKLKSKNWNNVAKGIQELAVMEQHHKMPEIFNEINSKNEHVRMEAQSALVHLSGFGGLWFLNVLNYPISEWQQMRLISMLSSSPVSDIPDLHLLLTSPNKSLVIFTLKLIGVFQQRTMHNEVVKCLSNKSESIRFAAIKCLKEIYNPFTVDALIRRFTKETRKNKIEIVKVIGEIGNEYQTDFLLEVLANHEDALKISAAKALSNMGNKANYLLEDYCSRHGDPYTQIFLHIKSAVQL